MKNIQITLQPLSLIVGAGLLGIMLITTGAFTPQGTASARDVSATEIVGPFNPRTAIRVTEGTPYTVPTGKRFVLTTLARIGGGSAWNFSVRVNGVDDIFTTIGYDPKEVAPGFVYSEGTVIEAYIGHSSTSARVLGYLVDA